MLNQLPIRSLVDTIITDKTFERYSLYNRNMMYGRVVNRLVFCAGIVSETSLYVQISTV